MKKHISLMLLIFILTLVAGCTDSIEPKANETEVTKKTYETGEQILKDGFDEYYFGGIIENSIVINKVYMAEGDSSYSMPLYIDLESKDVKLSGVDYGVKITKVERSKNQVTILLKRSK